MTYRVFLVEPLDVCRRMLSDALLRNNHGAFTVVAETPHTENAPAIAARVKPHVVVFTINDGEGLAHLKELHENQPDSHIVVLARMDGRPDMLLEVLRGGATAFLPQTAEPETIVEAIVRATNGQQTIDVESMTEAIRWTVDGASNGHDPLTDREHEVLDLLAQGLSSSAISQQLWISRRTVESHLSNSYRKLGVSGRITAIRAYGEYRRRHGARTP